MNTLYEVHTTDEEVLYIRTDLDIEIWIEEYEAQYHKTVAEFDKVEELLTGTESAVAYMEWWAA